MGLREIGSESFLEIVLQYKDHKMAIIVAYKTGA